VIECLYVENKTICTTLDYENDPDKYRGLIYCLECNSKAWFIKGYKTDKIDRMACFAAHHKENCNAATVEIGSDDSDELEANDQKNSSDIRVDLDKTVNASIYVSQPNDKHGDEESDWRTNKQKKPLGNASGFPLNKSLRQILTNLCRNPNYADKGQTITIVADSGRVILSGELQANLVKLENITKDHVGRQCIFWGTINNLNVDKKGILWLNYGDYRKEPSVKFSPSLKDQLLKNFKIKDVSELDGSDVIVVGNVGFSPNGKAIVQTGFTKYISFRRVEVKTDGARGDVNV